MAGFTCDAPERSMDVDPANVFRGLVSRNIEMYSPGHDVTVAFGNKAQLGVNIGRDIMYTLAEDRLRVALSNNRTKMDPLDFLLQKTDASGNLLISVEDGIFKILRERIQSVCNLTFSLHDGPPEKADLLIVFSIGINGVAEMGKPTGRFVHPRGACSGSVQYKNLCHNMTIGTYSLPVIMHEVMHFLGLMHETVHPDRPFTFSPEGWEQLGGDQKAREYNFGTVSPTSFRDRPPFDMLSIMLYEVGGHLMQKDDRLINVTRNMYPSAADLLTLRFFYPGRVDIDGLDALYRSWYGEGLLDNLNRSWARVEEFRSECFDVYGSCEQIAIQGRCDVHGKMCRKRCGLCKPVLSSRTSHPYYDPLTKSTIASVAEDEVSRFLVLVMCLVLVILAYMGYVRDRGTRKFAVISIFIYIGFVYRDRRMLAILIAGAILAYLSFTSLGDNPAKKM